MNYPRLFVVLVLLLIAESRWPIAAVEAARLGQHGALPIVYLEGAPYEIGVQHGELLREGVHGTVRQLLSYFRGQVKVPLVASLIVNGWLDWSWRQSKPFIPAEYLEELRGVADGSGVSLVELMRLHAIPDRTYTCANLAAWGRATSGGRLVHLRNLDWNIGAGVQDYPAVFVVRPHGKQPFVSAGWAGFIGVLSGINAQRISIGQVGAETADLTWRGVPLVFLMRRVMEDAHTLDEAVSIIEKGPRTVGINYVIADAKAGRAVAVETTAHHMAVFEADDPREHAVSYAKPIVDAVFRADTAVDPTIRERQRASKGNPKKPGLEPPGGAAYETRYLGQATMVQRHYGRIDLPIAEQIAGSVAPDSNIQSVIFAWPDLWVSNARGTTPATQTTYHHLNLEQLFFQSESDAAVPPPSR